MSAGGYNSITQDPESGPLAVEDDETFFDKLNKHEIDKNSVEVPDDPVHPGFSWRKLWAFCGPGILMSIAYLDPGNLESDLQSGAQGGYTLLWVLFWSTAIGNLLQILAARLGVVTGKNMAEVCKEQLPRAASLTLWIMAEIAIISSDIQEVVGSAIAMKILFGIPLWGGVLITAMDTFTFLLVHYYGVRKLEFLFAALVGIMTICFAVCFGISKPDGGEIIKGLVVPYCSSDTVVQAVGTLGAVIMPHNLYLHSALVQSRAIDRTNRPAVAEANFYNAIESTGSLAISFVINLMVVAVFAAGFYGTDGSGDIGLQEAGLRLGERFGEATKYIWAIGLLSAGQSSTMTGTLAGQYVMQGFIDLQVSPWMRVMITRSIAIVPAVIVALSGGTAGNGGVSLDTLDEWLNVVQSIQLPFALLPLLLFSSEAAIMAEFTIGFSLQVLVWVIFLVVMAVNVYLFQSFASENLPETGWSYFLYVVLAILYFGFMIYLAYRQLYAAPRERGLRQSLGQIAGSSSINGPTTPIAGSSTTLLSVAGGDASETTLLRG